MTTAHYVRPPARKNQPATQVSLKPLSDDRFEVTVGDRTWEVEAYPYAGGVALKHNGRSVDARVFWRDGVAQVSLGGHPTRFELEDARTHALKMATGGGSSGAKPVVVSPMAGKVVLVKVAVGDHVAANQTLVIIEAMKMENEIRALAAGKVVQVFVKAGDLVKPGDKLVELAYDEA